jgi:hypothetical protein
MARVLARAVSLLLAAALSLLPRVARAQECTPLSSISIFMVFQEDNPDQVFFSENGCLSGGGRGTGCCAGSECAVCEHNQVTSVSGKTMKWNSCMCEPCKPGSVQFRVGQSACVECPAGWYQPLEGQTECQQCPSGTFNPSTGRSENCVLCPPGTFSKSDILAYREATTKLYRGLNTEFDETAGAVVCTNCAAGTYQPSAGGRNAEECLPCPRGTYSDAGAAECTLCPAGFYQPHAGQAGAGSCLPCQAGKCSDTPGSVDCYQCCPVANLRCDAYLKRAQGFYGTVDWYGNGEDPGENIDDMYDIFLLQLCLRGCETYSVANWCATGTCTGISDALAAAIAAKGN